MFQINYRYFFDETDQIKGTDGYFQMLVNDKEYGLLIDKNLEAFSVSIYWWFYYLLESCIILENETLVYIRDIETDATWIKIKKESNDLIISEIKASPTYGQGAIVTNVLFNESEGEWTDEKLNYREFKHEVIIKVKSYIHDLKKINDDCDEILSLELLVYKTENFI